MKKQLPSRPHLDHLRAEAKELLRSSTEFSNLAEAQHAIAELYGFDKWASLRAHVEAETVARLDPALWIEKADTFKIFRAHPNPENDWWLALANCDFQLVSKLLGDDPSLADVAGGALNRHPLHYITCLQVFVGDAVGCTRELLRAGANPNATYIHKHYPDSPLPVLWGAVSIKHDVDLVQVLLEAGANPNDNESLYHSVEHDEPEIMRLLIEHGVDANSFNGLARALDFPRIKQVEMLLEAGANPNSKLGSENMAHHAIRRGRTLPFIELLVRYGVDLQGKSNDRLTLVEHAALRGDWSTFCYLRDLMGESVSAEMEYVAQVRGGQPITVLRPERLSFAVHSLLGLAVFNGERDMAKRMLDAGWPVDARHDGSTPLHCACFIGDEVMVELLIGLGAPLDVKDSHHHSSPLGWVLYGEVHSQMPRGDYEKCLRLMIEAGCARPNREWLASDDMRDVIAEYGYWAD